MLNDLEELGIISGAGFGMRDANEPMLWFDVRTLRGGSLQCFCGNDIFRIISESAVYDVHDLNRKPCVVTVDGGLMAFVRFHK